MFIGRQQELQALKKLQKKQTASLVIVKGRRRIGKSSLIEEFAKNSNFIQISGVAPSVSSTTQSQIDHFMDQACLALNMETIKLTTWNRAFNFLAKAIKDTKTVVLLDEISWMGSKDPDFLGQLKNAWDHEFSKKSQLILVLCGSISTWINKEIINGTAFLGRPSLIISLQELSLMESLLLLSRSDKKNIISPYEKLKILSLTGGIPRYLELVTPQLPADANLKQLLFSPNAPLLKEYDRVFNDIFGERSSMYKTIIECLISGPKMQAEILQEIARKKGGDISLYLDELVESGFVHRDYTFNIKTQKLSKKSKYRLKDNFLRFYLKFVMPNLLKIQAGLFEQKTLSNLPGWLVTQGLQFENLILNNIKWVAEQLEIDLSTIVFFGPYFKTATKTASGCQIDLLIQTHLNILYICEIKFSKQRIGLEVYGQVSEKIKQMRIPRGYSAIPVLIHANGISEELEDSRLFPYVISVGELI